MPTPPGQILLWSVESQYKFCCEHKCRMLSEGYLAEYPDSQESKYESLHVLFANQIQTKYWWGLSWFEKNNCHPIQVARSAYNIAVCSTKISSDFFANNWFSRRCRRHYDTLWPHHCQHRRPGNQLHPVLKSYFGEKGKLTGYPYSYIFHNSLHTKCFWIETDWFGPKSLKCPNYLMTRKDWLQA